MALAINPAKIEDQLTKFIATSFKKSGYARAVIAMSGGVDSSTSAALAVRALRPEDVFGVLLPYGDFNQQGVTDAKTVIEFLKIPQENVVHINIKPLVDPLIAIDPSMDEIRRGNMMARVRMIVLFDQAKKRSALVVGTENKSEHLLGYFTRFGDSASDIEPLRNLYKTQVYQLAKYVGIPRPILTKPPTAGLWPGQTDEGEFGFTYKDADEILFLLYDKKMSEENIVAEGFDSNVVARVISRVNRNTFKHRLPLLPPEV